MSGPTLGLDGSRLWCALQQEPLVTVLRVDGRPQFPCPLLCRPPPTSLPQPLFAVRCEWCFGVFRMRVSHGNPDGQLCLTTANAINSGIMARSFAAAGLQLTKSNAGVGSGMGEPDPITRRTSGKLVDDAWVHLKQTKSIKPSSGQDPSLGLCQCLRRGLNAQPRVQVAAHWQA